MFIDNPLPVCTRSTPSARLSCPATQRLSVCYTCPKQHATRGLRFLGRMGCRTGAAAFHATQVSHTTTSKKGGDAPPPVLRVGQTTPAASGPVFRSALRFAVRRWFSSNVVHDNDRCAAGAISSEQGAQSHTVWRAVVITAGHPYHTTQSLKFRRASTLFALPWLAADPPAWAPPRQLGDTQRRLARRPFPPCAC